MLTLQMKTRHMLKYIISSVFALLTTFSVMSQNDSIVNDSIRHAQKYGLRLGGDFSKIAKTIIDDDYTGFEINADYRLSKNLYVAGEIGTEERTKYNEFLNATAKGSYFKGGVDYNMYKNWFGMENMIYSGFRVGASSFSQTRNSYTVYTTNQSWPQTIISDGEEFKGLTAIWAEIILGLKAELVKNIYVGFNVQLKARISETEPNNFENIFIPGFGRTYDSGRFGIAFGYNVSYLIPLYKKGN